MDTSQMPPIGLAFLAGAMALIARLRRPLAARDIEEAHQRLASHAIT